MSLFSCYFLSYSLPPHGLQQPRLVCPSLSPGLCWNSCSWFEMVDDAIKASHPLPSPVLLFLIFPRIKVFSSDSAPCIRWAKLWSFSFSISPSNEYSLEYSHPTLTSTHDYWKNRSFDYMDLCRWSDVSVSFFFFLSVVLF